MIVPQVAAVIGWPCNLITGRARHQPRLRRTVTGGIVGDRPATPPAMSPDLSAYNAAAEAPHAAICTLLAAEITRALPDAEGRLYHGHPAWFLAGNPLVGYSVLKGSTRLLFWSGQSFDEPALSNEGKFKAAEARYIDVAQVDTVAVRRWLGKARDIQWDYKNIVKRKGVLERLR